MKIVEKRDSKVASESFSGQEITVSSHNFPILNGHTTRSERPKLGLIRPLIGSLVKSKKVYANPSSNHWSSTENSSTNSWNVNFSDGNINNNNKYNSNVVRPCVALEIEEISGWYEAFLDCCQRKKSTIQCSIYRSNFETDILKLIREVKSRTYIPSVSTCFVISRPKYREIFAANFRDRIAQHWVIQRIEPLLEERFVSQGNVSFNCRKGYGTSAAVKRLDQNIKEVSLGYTKTAWIGKFDMRSFFMSIDKEILLNLLIPFIREKYKGSDIEDLIWLITVIIRHEPQENCIKRGRLNLWDELPPQKSLFNSPRGIGMPIGNITSQLLANFYLSFLDEYMNALCSSIGAKYVRFVDDFIVVCKEKHQIKRLWKKANKFLLDKLHIVLHPDKIYIQEVKKGVKFVGSVIKPGRIYLSNRSVGGFASTLHTLDRVCCRVYFETQKNFDCRIILKDLEHYISSINSYMGFLIHTSSYGIRCKFINSLSWFWGVCDVDTKTKVVKIKPEYKLINYYGKDRKKQTRSSNIRGKHKKVLLRKHRASPE